MNEKCNQATHLRIFNFILLLRRFFSLQVFIHSSIHWKSSFHTYARTPFGALIEILNFVACKREWSWRKTLHIFFFILLHFIAMHILSRCFIPIILPSWTSRIFHMPNHVENMLLKWALCIPFRCRSSV